jgi:uncharacterized membrane protein YgcG
MNRRLLIAACVAVALGTGPSWAADSYQDLYVRQLESQGFRNIQVSRTWLGRTRITASSKTHEREIIFNTRSGEILRDYWDSADDDGSGSVGLIDPKDDGSDDDNGSSGGNSGPGGSSGGNSGPGGSGGDGGSGGGGDHAVLLRVDSYLSGGVDGDVTFV